MSECIHKFIMKHFNDEGMPSHYLVCAKCGKTKDVGDTI